MKASTIIFFSIFALMNISSVRSNADERIFNRFDLNGDGKITIEEVKTRLANDDGVDKEALADLLFHVGDLNKDGFITLDEFCSDAAGDSLFKIVDKNGDGKISFEEFRISFQTMFKDVPREGAQITFGFVDADKDGYISREEALGIHHDGLRIVFGK